MSKKMTIAETFAEIIATYDLTDAHKAFLLDRIEKATRKSSTGEKKLTTKQLLNIAVADEVYAFMAQTPDKVFTVSELLKVCPAFTAIDECSASYANAIVKKLKDSGRVERTEVKGRAYFTAVI